MTAAAPGLSIAALALAVETDHRYVDAACCPVETDLTGLLSGRSAPAAAPRGAGLLTADLAVVAEHSGIPLPSLRMLTVREDGVELARRALTALGPPPHPQPLLLVQSSPDRDPLGAALPRLVHELGWPITEDLGLTHLGDVGGIAMAGLLSWWMDEAVGASVVVVDQPLFAREDLVPQQLTAVALRFGGNGPQHVLAWGEGAAPVTADRTYSGPGACGGWPDLCRAMDRGELGPGESVLLRSGGGQRQAWLLLRHTPVEAAASSDRHDPRS